MDHSVAEFMARVVPWPYPGESGHINMHWTSPRHKSVGGKPFTKLADFLAMVPWCNAHTDWIKDVYFCLSRQSQAGEPKHGRETAKRSAENATHLSSIWLDIDCNKEPPKGYHTKENGRSALTAFCTIARLPPPSAIVDSGNGLHVYWFSLSALTQAQWRPYAEGLYALAQKYELHCDPITTDAARILRVPGTLNYKSAPPKLVTIVHSGNSYDFKKEMTAAAEEKPVHIPTRTVHVEPLFDPARFPQLTPITDPARKLAADIQHESPPIDAHSVIEQCPHFKDADLTGGEQHNQGLWMQTVLASTWFENGRAIAHELSSKHPGYTVEACDEMFDRKVRDREDRGLGWPSCNAFERNGCTKCATCPHKGKIRSPLNLGRPILPPISVVAGEEIPAADLPPTAESLQLPNGYVLGHNKPYIGYIYNKPIGKGMTTPVFAPLFRCVIDKPWMQKNPRVLHFTASADKGNTIYASVPMESTGAVESLCKHLAKQGVNTDPPNRKELLTFMSHWIEKLHAQVAADTVPFGWWIDKGETHGFAYGGVIRKDDGSTIPSGVSDPQLSHYHTPKGLIGPWFEALRLITDQHRPQVEAMVAAAFGGPLLRSTGQYSGSLCGYSQSGGNKSTAITIGLAVWGHPKHTKETESSSEKGLLSKMGHRRHIPSFWDDVNDPTVVDRVGSTLSKLSQGVDGTKLKSDRTYHEVGDWQTLLVVASNMSLFDALLRKQKSHSALVHRLFEYRAADATDETPGRVESWVAQRRLQTLEENYGRMGEKYAALLAADPKGVDKLVVETMEVLAKEVGARSVERFWVATAACVIAGARLANLCGATFNVNELHHFMVAKFLELRERVRGENIGGSTADNTEAVLTGFLKHHAADTLRTKDIAPSVRGKPKKVAVISGPNPNYKYIIHIQWVVERRLLRFSKAAFIKWVDDNKYSPAMTLSGLKEHFGITMPYPVANMCAGTEYQGGQEQLIVMPVPEGSWLEDSMFANTPVSEMPIPIRTDQSGNLLGIVDNAAKQP